MAGGGHRPVGEHPRFRRVDRRAGRLRAVPGQDRSHRLADAGGVYLTLHDIGLEIAPADLLAGRLHIRSLTVAEIDMARPSIGGRRAPLSEYLRVPHLPLALVLDRLAIARLALAPAVLGESVVATIAGSAEIRRGAARAALDLHRIDGVPGKLALRMSLTGTNPVLSLRLHASEPTGILLDRWLGRTDRLPLTLSLDGRGPVADWHGRLTASAGADARLDADVALEVGSADRSRPVRKRGGGAVAAGRSRLADRRPSRLLRCA